MSYRRVGFAVSVAFLSLTLSASAALAVASFSPAVRLGFPHGDDWEPAIAADRYGHVYALYTHYVGYTSTSGGDVDPTCAGCASPHMVLQVSSDRGATWSSPRALTPAVTGRQDDPQIVVDAADGRTLYASYMQDNKGNMYVAKSTDFGATWRTMLVEPLQRGTDKDILAARAGDVYLVYHTQEKIYASVYLRSRGTWTLHQPINNTNSTFGVSLPSGGAIDSHGNAHFAWNGVTQPGQAKGDINLYVTSTYNHGATWSTSLVDVSKAPPVCGCAGWDFWGAQMALTVDANDAVYVAWEASQIDQGPNNLFFAKSTDGARTWTRKRNVSLAPAATNEAFPALVAGAAGDVRLAWQDDRNGHDAGGSDPNARWNTWYRESKDGGATWSSEVRLSRYVSGYSYKLATPKQGYLQPYGDYFEIDIDSAGTTQALWGEGNSYAGPGNVWYARQP